MAIGSAWTETTPGSTSKMNFMDLVSGTGVELAALDKTKHRLVTCTSTGSGYTLDHVYLFNTAGDDKIDLTSIAAHTHTDSTDGGSLYDILRSNPTFIDTGATLFLNSGLDVNYWYTAISGTGAEPVGDRTATVDSIKLATGATSGSLSELTNFTTGGLNKIDFTKRSTIQMKLKIGTATSLALKAGINCETVTSADDNTVKYEAQVCTVTNPNWNLRTADGSSNTESDTGTAISANTVSIRLEHFPDLGTPKVDMYVDSASAFSKTTNIPTTGNSEVNATPKFSLKNSTTADRTLYYYGCRMQYFIDDQWF